MSPRRLAVCIVIAMTLWSEQVFADVPLPSGHITLISGEGVLVTQYGTRYTLPVGTHILDGTSWGNLDLEVKRLQDQETRLKAENNSLKGSAQRDAPGWGTAAVLLTVVAAISGGVYYFQTN